jgi:hypothetical protein
MYLDNKYTRIYYSIVNRARDRKLIGYIEKHHIIPKSLGGNDSSENLVKLIAREHFICHRLLTKMTEGESKSKMHQAVWMMTVTNSDNQNRHKVTNRVYETLKLNMSLMKRGKSTWNKGISPSYETKMLLRNRTLQYNHSIGKISDDELKLAIKLPLGEKLPRRKRKSKTKSMPRKTGYKFTKSIPANRICCIHCRKDIPVANFANSHGDKCRLKNTL